MASSIKPLSKFIEVFDNLLEHDYKTFVYSFVTKSLFSIGWKDTNEIDLKSHAYLHSVYDDKDVSNLGILEKLKDTDLGKKIANLTLKRTVVNLSVPTETHFAHTHEGTTLLYYANMKWNEEWAGETQFYNDNVDEVIYTSMYTPGRFILFDGTIPHTLRPQTPIAPMYRFTIAFQFDLEI